MHDRREALDDARSGKARWVGARRRVTATQRQQHGDRDDEHGGTAERERRRLNALHGSSARMRSKYGDSPSGAARSSAGRRPSRSLYAT